MTKSQAAPHEEDRNEANELGDDETKKPDKSLEFSTRRLEVANSAEGSSHI